MFTIIKKAQLVKKKKSIKELFLENVSTSSIPEDEDYLDLNINSDMNSSCNAMSDILEISSKSKSEPLSKRKLCPLPSCGMKRASISAMKKHLGILEGQEGNGNCESSFYNFNICKPCFRPKNGDTSQGNKYHLVIPILSNIDNILEDLFK